MKNLLYANPLRLRRRDRIIVTALMISALSLGASGAIAQAQSPVTTITLGQDKIGLIRTTPGISTRVSFPEVVQEIICGDLYDPGNRVGSFVIQRSGKDVFIKPVAPKGMSNMFVKTGANAEHVYSFDLEIVKADQAHRIVNVLSAMAAPAGETRAAKKVRPSFRTPPVIAQIDETPARQTVNGSHGILEGRMLVNAGHASPPPPPRMDDELNKEPDDKPVEAEKRVSKPVGIQGEPIKMVRASYPDYARRSGMSGEVEVEITIDEAGKVISARAISGPRIFRQAAIYAAQEWRFPPTIVSGVPVQATGSIIFVFNKPATFSNALNLTDYVWDRPRRPR